MTPDQHEAAEECLADLIALGEMVEALGNMTSPGEMQPTWLAAVGSITRRLARQASSHLGDIGG